MIRFIDEYPNRFSLKLMCATLKNNRKWGFITSLGYRQPKARGMSARRLHDAAFLSTFATLTLIPMVCGRYGTRLSVKESLSTESRLLDCCVRPDCLAKAKAGHL